MKIILFFRINYFYFSLQSPFGLILFVLRCFSLFISSEYWDWFNTSKLLCFSQLHLKLNEMFSLPNIFFL